MTVLQSPAGFLSNDHLPRVSRQSRLSANDKGEFSLLLRKPGKPQRGDRLMNAVRPVIASNGVTFPQVLE